MEKYALIVGNSDGIGLALTRRLLDEGWQVRGLSRSPSPIDHSCYRHSVVDVASNEFGPRLIDGIGDVPDLFVHCAGIGEQLQFDDMDRERRTFEVNLMSAVTAISVVLPAFLQKGAGHIVVLSSQVDRLVSPQAPAYAASKAALTSYLEGIALAVRSRGIAVTNVRFGFVDTKMAKARSMPLLMSTDRAVGHLMACIEKKPIRYTRPRLLALLITFLQLWTRASTPFLNH